MKNSAITKRTRVKRVILHFQLSVVSLQTGSWIACNPVTAVRRDEVGREDESRGRSKMMNSNRKPQMEAARALHAGSHEVQRGSSLTKGE